MGTSAGLRQPDDSKPAVPSTQNAWITADSGSMMVALWGRW